jgi:hypothetical protein
MIGPRRPGSEPTATPPKPSEATTDSADDDREQLETLALQLQALGDAVELGAPLTTRQVCLLLAARPGGDRVTRAGRRGRAEPSV